MFTRGVKHRYTAEALLLCGRYPEWPIYLDACGVYSLTIGSQAIGHASAGATTIAAGAQNQAWSIAIAAAGVEFTATIQNAVTRSFIGLGRDSNKNTIVSPTTSSQSWTIVRSNGGASRFCIAQEQCLTVLAPGSSALTLALINSTAQDFSVLPATPPPGVYQVQNIATRNIVAAGGIPFPAGMASFPANDRSEVWQVGQTDGGAITLQNFDSGGFLSVQPQGLAVGTFGFTPVSWAIVYVDGVGQILQTSTGASMTAAGNGVSISGARDTTAAWAFFPEDGNEFLP
ncbi:hypothetical protein AURDEDRAFT_112945 [Auricularia subglabra TFB-10046 SS5]|nr:hypothetical protein AURDEDRAFT_112945 [Auricularia subglabra TFB-10046 SS5]